MKVINTQGKYDGSQIAPGWAHKEFRTGESEDSIVVMRGPMDVSEEEMVDLEDLKAGEEIKGGDLIHFIIEHHDSDNIEIAYLLQKMEAYEGIVILATNLLENLDAAFSRRIHFSELDEHLDELPHDQTIVAYCT